MSKRLFIFGFEGVLSERGKPNLSLRNMINALDPHWASIWVLTTRSNDRRVETHNWLMENGFLFHRLLMLPTYFDGEPYDYKCQVIETNIKNGYQILGVFEGNPYTSWRLRSRFGIPVCSVGSDSFIGQGSPALTFSGDSLAAGYDTVTSSTSGTFRWWTNPGEG